MLNALFSLESLKDLLINLIAGLICTFIAVFIIDRLLKGREEKRWLIPKHLIHAKLLGVVSTFLKDGLHVRWQEPPHFYFKFGDINVYTGGELVGDGHKEALEKLRELSSTNISKKFNSEVFNETYRELETIRYVTIHLLDPELISLLLGFEIELQGAIKLAHDNPGVPHILGAIGIKAVELIAWLERKADLAWTLEEEIEAVMNAKA
jgi:hypothetical protein